MQPAVYLIATMDTKGHELAFVAEVLRRHQIPAQTIDVGTQAPPQVAPDISRETVLGGALLPSNVDRADAIAVMARALTKFLRDRHRSGATRGVLGLGGSGGTSLITTALRELPVGLPKLVVSTVASGQTAAYIGCSDITLMPSVVDVAGLNRVSRRILENAALAMSGMCSQSSIEEDDAKTTVAMTMFGVTTPCVTHVREELERDGADCLVFHATGTGGRAMESLVASGMINGVLDLTTTEVADEVVGGIFPAGSSRFKALLETDIPLVMSVGAVDMVNFGGLETVPERFRHRNLHVHNAEVTLMRTTAEENREIARWMASRWNQGDGPWTLLLPEKGVSMLDAEQQPFYDPAADAALFETLESELTVSAHRRIVRLPFHMNDPEFAQRVVEEYRALAVH